VQSNLSIRDAPPLFRADERAVTRCTARPIRPGHRRPTRCAPVRSLPASASSCKINRLESHSRITTQSRWQGPGRGGTADCRPLAPAPAAQCHLPDGRAPRVSCGRRSASFDARPDDGGFDPRPRNTPRRPGAADARMIRVINRIFFAQGGHPPGFLSRKRPQHNDRTSAWSSTESTRCQMTICTEPCHPGLTPTGRWIPRTV